MKQKKLCDSIKKINLSLCAAWGLPVLLMLILFGIDGVYPFGNRSFVVSDMYHQYMPFFTEFMEKIKAGEGLGYSYHVGIGSNFLALYVYYLASPLHWLAFLFPKGALMEFLTYLVVFKIGLSGWSLCYYLQKHFQKSSLSSVLFSTFYAMSGYMMAYNWNIMWLDCVILFPLIILGLERLVKEGKCGLYCVMLGLSIFSNYYISIMICIFQVLYFFYLLLTERKGFGVVWRFAVSSLLAGGMAGILLIPEVLAIVQTDFGSSTFPAEVKAYFSILDELARHCISVSTERGLAHWPNIYCGVAVFMLVPMFILNSQISIRRRFGMCALVGFLLFGFSTNALDFLWHGYNYPDSLPARQAFIYIFLVLVMCYEGFLYRMDESPKLMVYSYLCGMVFLLFCEKFVESEDFSFGVIMLTMLFLSLYAVILYCSRKYEDIEWKNALLVLGFVVVSAELCINMVSTNVGTSNRETYLSEMSDYQVLYESAKEREEGLFRLEKFERVTKNDGVLAGYPSASLFSSTQNSKVADWYERLGMRHSKVYYCYDGATPFTSALLNVNYMYGDKDEEAVNIGDIKKEKLYTFLENSGNVNLYQCNYVLPFGYVAPKEYEMPEGFKQSPLRLQNAMVNRLGIEEELFVRENSGTMGEEIVLNVEEDGYYYMVVAASGTKKIEATMIQGNKTFKDLKKGCVLSLGFQKAGSSISFVNADSADETPKIKLDAYRMNEEVLAQALEILSKQHLEELVFDSKRISGKLHLEEEGRMILSVPYEKGWKVMVNGAETEPKVFGDVFMAFDLEPGDYTIEMKYVPYGRGLGILVTLGSIVLFSVFMILDKKKRNAVEL